MRRLARMLAFGALLLLIGAVVNVALAWALSPAEVPDPRRSFVGRLDEQWWTRTDPQPAWPRRTPDRWSEPLAGTMYQRRGASHRIWLAYPNGERACSITITSSGWPVRSLAYEQWSEYAPGVDAQQTSDHPRSPFRLGIPWRGGPKRLPLAPIPAGFAINTLLYSAIAAGVWLGARRMRSAVRVRRGRCSGCGYSRVGLGPGAPCPECGRRQVAGGAS